MQAAAGALGRHSLASSIETHLVAPPPPPPPPPPARQLPASYPLHHLMEGRAGRTHLAATAYSNSRPVLLASPPHNSYHCPRLTILVTQIATGQHRLLLLPKRGHCAGQYQRAAKHGLAIHNPSLAHNFSRTRQDCVGRRSHFHSSINPSNGDCQPHASGLLVQ